MCIIDCLSTIVFILPLYLDDTKVIILILWRRTFQLEYWRTFQLVSTQFIDTQTGKVNWEGYDEIDITYAIERKYVTFNSNALYLGGAPWVIKSYTKKHIILMQNEASPDKEKIATIELDRID